MTEKAISPLRRRLIEDMTIRRLSTNTQHQYIRHVKSFADFVGRSADKATAEDVHRYQLHLGSIGTTIPTVPLPAPPMRRHANLPNDRFRRACGRSALGAPMARQRRRTKPLSQ